MEIIVDSVRGKIHNCYPSLARKLAKKCRYRAYNYQFSDAFVDGRWDGYVNKFNVKLCTFPSGLLYKIKKILKKEKIEFKVKDKRHELIWENNLVLKNIDNFSYVLRDYQIDGLIAGLNNPYMTFWWATSSGKTVQFAAICSALKKKEFRKTLILVTTKDLAAQHREEMGRMLGEKIGLIEEGRFEPEKITVAVINTLFNKAIRQKEKKVLNFLDLIEYLIVDECLDGKALILMPDGSQKTIKRLVEDRDKYVATVTKEGKIVKGRVVRWIKNPIRGRKKLKITVRKFWGKAGGVLICTEDHKVYTVKRGKIKARDLIIGEQIWISRRIKNESKNKINKTEGRNVSGSLGGQYYALTKSLLSKNLDLLEELSKVKKKDIKFFLAKWDNDLPSRIRESRLVVSLSIGRLLPTEEQVHHKDEDQLDDYIDNLEIQPISIHSSKSGNQYSRNKKRKIEFTKGHVIDIEEYSNSTSGRQVYNLEVEKTHRYFANCILVANCHHLIDSSTMKRVVNKCKNTVARHGFSGTPYSLTTDDIELECLTGPPLSKITMSDLILGGWVSRPKITMIHYDYPWMGGRAIYSTAYDRQIVHNKVRNKIIVDKAFKEYSINNKIVLVLVRIIVHGKILLEMFQKKGIYIGDVEFIHGSSPKAQRREVKEKMKRKELGLVIASQIWNEGIDVPSIDVLVKADGGGGNSVTDTKGVRSVVQQAGRVVRKPVKAGELDVNNAVENTVKIYDFYDNVHKDLVKHSKNRLDTYMMEPEFKVKEIKI